MTLKTNKEVKGLTWYELDLYYWELYNELHDTLLYRQSKSMIKQFKYVYNRLKL